MFKLSKMFGRRGGSDAFGRRAVKNMGIRRDIGQTFAETGTTSVYGYLGAIYSFPGVKVTQGHELQSHQS